MNLKYAAGIAGAVVLLAGAVIAQTVSVPQVSVINTDDLIQVIPHGNPRVGNVYATPSLITAQKGYYKSVPLTGFTFTFGNSQSVAAFDAGSTIATGIVTLAPGPSDGAQECIFSTGIISTLTVSANTGQTINDAISSLAANAHACYLYSKADLTWVRSE